MTPDRRNLLRLANLPSLDASFKFKLLINRMLFVTAGTMSDEPDDFTKRK